MEWMAEMDRAVTFRNEINAVSAYLNVELAHLTWALECLKACDSNEHVAALGDALRDVLVWLRNDSRMIDRLVVRR